MNCDVLCILPKLTPEEEEKRRLRRERNKLAAFRCRQRRKQHIVDLELVCNRDNFLHTKLNSKNSQ